MESLVGLDPGLVLPHGPSKLLVDEYLWHLPNAGIVASYTPKERDVRDHFGVFRAVDQVESFGQATAVSCSAFLDSNKTGIGYKEYYKERNFVFMSIEKVLCHNFIRLNERYICIGIITFYKFRQMATSGRIYKVVTDLDLKNYFKSFTEESLRNFRLTEDFVLVTEIEKVISKGIKIEKLY